MQWAANQKIENSQNRLKVLIQAHSQLSCPHHTWFLSIGIITSPDGTSSQPNVTLSLSCHPFREWSMVRFVLDTHAIGHQSPISPHRLILFTIPLGKAPLPAHVNLKQAQTHKQSVVFTNMPISILAIVHGIPVYSAKKLSSVGSFLYT